MTIKTLQLPLIHMNGTSRESLDDAIETAHRAITDAMDALKHCAPNGRDYYPLGPQALTDAINQHRNRQHQLDEVRRELEAMAAGISDNATTVEHKPLEPHCD